MAYRARPGVLLMALWVNPANGAIYVFGRTPQGKFELGDPARGPLKDEKDLRVQVGNLGDAIALLEDGFHPLLHHRESNNWKMVAPEKVQIVEVPK